MISPQDITELVQAQMPDAEVGVMDRTGMQDHYIIHVVSEAFKGKGVMDRHRMVYAALEPAMKDGRLHAAEIKTELPA
jgi:stress-induced morphogen